ncbi:hypothetical protein DVH05_006885 [Phytophthora capsici]|nr:hypothetical protein DVH05_006885 [Phytophthora capsici]
MSRSSSSSVWTRDSESHWKMPENKDPSRIILSTLQVKVMPMQRGFPAIAEDLKQRNRFSKWLKTSFQWCVKALTLRCLWKKPTTFTEEIATSTQAPAVQSKPIVSRNHHRSSASIGQSPIQDRNLQRKSQSTSPFAKVDDGLNTRNTRLAARESAAKRLLTPTRDPVKKSGIWSADEHERYCEALEMFRYGSWKQIAGYVGTRTERQVLSHAQSIRARKEKGKQRRTAVQSGVHQELWRNLFAETHKCTPEELLAASMTDAPPNPLSGLGHSTDAANSSATDFPSMDLSFELNIDDFEVANADEESKNGGWEEFTRNKRAKPNSE